MASESQKQHLGYSEVFEHRWAIFQKTMWVFLTLFILAGASGLLGKGPLSKRTLSIESGQVEFERVLRHQSPGQLVVHFRSPSTGDASIKLPAAWLALMQVRSITPLPDKEVLNPDGLTYEFASMAGSSGRAVIAFIPAYVGSVDAELLINGHESVTLPFTILP